MAKVYDFEVSTGLTVTQPIGFNASVAQLGASVFDKVRKTGYYLADEGGIGTRPKDQRFRAVEPRKNRYIHFDRNITPYGPTVLKFYQLLQQIDSTLNAEGTIGSVDLKKEIAGELAAKIGECTIAGQEFAFDSIDDVPSARESDLRLFVLRPQKSEVREFGDVVQPLDVISGFLNTYMLDRHPEIYELGGSEAEGGLLIGSSTDTNPDRVETFKDLFNKTFLKDGPIIATANALMIKAGLAGFDQDTTTPL